MPEDHFQKTRCVILVRNLWRAIRFYRSVFGWRFNVNEQAEVAHTSRQTLRDELLCNSVDAVLRKQRSTDRQQDSENNKDVYVCTFFVKDFDAIARRIKQMHGRVVMKKYRIEGIGWQGYFLDTEGNMFGILERQKRFEYYPRHPMRM